MLKTSIESVAKNQILYFFPRIEQNLLFFPFKFMNQTNSKLKSNANIRVVYEYGMSRESEYGIVRRNSLRLFLRNKVLSGSNLLTSLSAIALTNEPRWVLVPLIISYIFPTERASNNVFFRRARTNDSGGMFSGGIAIFICR